MIRISLFLVLLFHVPCLFAIDSFNGGPCEAPFSKVGLAKVGETGFTEQKIVRILNNSQDTFVLDQSRLDSGFLLGRVSLSAEEKEAINQAHLVGSGEMGEDEVSPARVGNYTKAQMAEKVRILSPHFSRQQRRMLIEAGVVGMTLPDTAYGGRGTMDLQDTMTALIRTVKMESLEGLSPEEAEILRPYIISG